MNVIPIWYIVISSIFLIIMTRFIIKEIKWQKHLRNNYREIADGYYELVNRRDEE